MVKEDFGDIIKKDKLHFKNNRQLTKYYEKKYREGGYKKGYTLHGVNLSKIYHKARHKASLELLKPKKHEIILDAGCGGGDFSLLIAKKCKLVYGIDVSKSSFSKTKKNAPKNVIFEKGNVEKMRFKDEFFDKVVCIEILEHVLHPETTLKEVRRVLKKNGYLVLTYPTLGTTQMAKFERFLGTRDEAPVSEHLNNWGYSEIVKKLEKKGFKLVDVRAICFDLGRLYDLRKISKKMSSLITAITFKLNKFPKNSSFVAFLFKKV